MDKKKCEYESDDSDLALRSFHEYSSSSLEITNVESTIEENTENPLTKLVNNILFHRASNNNSFKSACTFAKTLNTMPGAQIQVPETKSVLQQQAKFKFNYIRYIICKCMCLKLTEKCPECGATTKKNKNNYFIHIPVKQQIEFFLRKYTKIICEFMNKRDLNDHEICDFYDGKIYKKIREQFCEDTILPFNLNIDGGKIFTSSKTSLWPIQLVQLYLPPEIRYLSQHILVVGLYCAPEKPDLAAIIQPFAEEMKNISNGIHIYFENKVLHFVPAIMFCTCDLPARAEIQNRKHSGYNSCHCCEHPGESLKNGLTKKSYVRYLQQSEKSALRSHSSCVAICRDILNGNKPIESNGYKGISCMILFSNFDLIDGFVTDWMHGSLLGVMKLLLDIWMGKKKLFFTEEEKKNYHFHPLSVNDKIQLNKRIMSLKPYQRLNHKPRSIIEDRAFFSANEYRSMLWYYMKFALQGILSRELITHFELFSSATYTLSKIRISRDEIKEADEMLNRFSNDFEKYYGKNSVTINIHMLKHYSTIVLNSGPL